MTLPEGLVYVPGFLTEAGERDVLAVLPAAVAVGELEPPHPASSTKARLVTAPSNDDLASGPCHVPSPYGEGCRKRHASGKGYHALRPGPLPPLASYDAVTMDADFLMCRNRDAFMPPATSEVCGRGLRLGRSLMRSWSTTPRRQ